MSRKKKKHVEEEAENNERWLVSYADFITLLFAFFVTMYASSRVDAKKMGSAVESIQRALGSVIPVQMPQSDPGVFSSQLTTSVSIVPRLTVDGKAASADERNLINKAEEIRKAIEAIEKGGEFNSRQGLKLSDQIKFVLEKRGLVIRISEHIFFSSGDASIRPEMEPILKVLARTMASIPNQIKIEGHTDNVPINTPRFPSNWELSTVRATTIVRYLLEHTRLDPEKISATGYGEFRPIDSNQTPEGRTQNRRVDFVILTNKEASDSEPEQVPDGAGERKK